MCPKNQKSESTNRKRQQFVKQPFTDFPESETFEAHEFVVTTFKPRPLNLVGSSNVMITEIVVRRLSKTYFQALLHLVAHNSILLPLSFALLNFNSQPALAGDDFLSAFDNCVMLLVASAFLWNFCKGEGVLKRS